MDFTSRLVQRKGVYHWTTSNHAANNGELTISSLICTTQPRPIHLIICSCLTTDHLFYQLPIQFYHYAYLLQSLWLCHSNWPFHFTIPTDSYLILTWLARSLPIGSVLEPTPSTRSVAVPPNWQFYHLGSGCATRMVLVLHGCYCATWTAVMLLPSGPRWVSELASVSKAYLVSLPTSFKDVGPAGYTLGDEVFPNHCSPSWSPNQGCSNPVHEIRAEQVRWLSTGSELSPVFSFPHF